MALLDMTAFSSRMFGVLTLVLLTEIIAGFAWVIAWRAGLVLKKHAGKDDAWLQSLAVGAILVVMSPLILLVSGLNVSWLDMVLHVEVVLFSNWMFWVGLSLLPVGLWAAFRGMPNVYTRLKQYTHQEAQSP